MSRGTDVTDMKRSYRTVVEGGYESLLKSILDKYDPKRPALDSRAIEDNSEE